MAAGSAERPPDGHKDHAMMDKTFRPAEVEARHYARWEQSGAFAARPQSPARP
jgi:hypothetical protein